MSIRCGHCHDQHDTTAQVLLCSRRTPPSASSSPVFACPSSAQREGWARIARIPVGSHQCAYYALPHEDGRSRLYEVHRPTTGKWANFTFLRHRRGEPIRGQEAYRILSAIAADPRAAAELYGEVTEECSQCGAELTNPDSVVRKMGPVCAQKFAAGVAVV